MSSTDKIIILKSSDGESVEVEKAVALQFGSINEMIEQKEQKDFPAEGIPLPNVTSRILSKVIEYCKMHVVDTDRDSSVAGDDLKAWDAEFVKVDQATLFALMKAAHYLKIKGLVDLTCQNLADRLKGKTPEEMAEIWGEEIDNTSEELKEFRREHSWAFE